MTSCDPHLETVEDLLEIAECLPETADLQSIWSMNILEEKIHLEETSVIISTKLTLLLNISTL